MAIAGPFVAGLASGEAKLVRKLLPATEVRIEFMNHGEPGVRLTESCYSLRKKFR